MLSASRAVGVRLIGRLALNPVTGCWEWTGCLDANGYGVTEISRKRRMVHRLMYELAGGHLPKGRVVDHLCRNRRCANPSHLEAVTQRENTLRGTSPAALNAQKTHCAQGHEFNEENTYSPPFKPNTRLCRICRRVRKAERRKRAKRKPGS